MFSTLYALKWYLFKHSLKPVKATVENIWIL